MTTNGQRFARLFSGYDKRYGRYDITGDAVAEQKVAGKARTVDKEITEADYQAHLDGNVGIGVIPLNSENLVNFAAIDIDVYKQADQAAKNLTHNDIALALFDTPLIVSRSKSGGIHVWLFAEPGVSARLATDYLKAKAAELGVAGTEVFPKQTERAGDDDVGNWINLPYFGGKRTAVIPDKRGSTYEFIDVSLEQFLDIAEHQASQVTEQFLLDNTKLPSSQRDSNDTTPLWYDGPPCLQALMIGHPERVEKIERDFARGDITEDQYKKKIAYTRPQLGEGGRNEAFFNAAIYLRRRMMPHDPDATLQKDDIADHAKMVNEVHSDWRAATGDPGIAAGRELETATKQAAKGKWGYACSKAPLSAHCNRRLCFKRRFGIGTAVNDAAFEITGFTIVDTEDKQYYMNVGGARIYVPDASSLLSQSDFARIVLNATDRVWVPMQETQYKKMMDQLLQNADHIEGPPDSDRAAEVLNALYDFVDKKKIERGKNDASFFTGRVLLSEDGLEAWFKLDQFFTFLRSRQTQFSPQVVVAMLTYRFGVYARGNTHIAGRQVRPYVVNIENLKNLIAPEVSDGEA